jgi:hypothetical protein
VLKTNVEQIEKNEGSYSYLYPFGDLTQGSFQEGFNNSKFKFWCSKFGVLGISMVGVLRFRFQWLGVFGIGIGFNI